MRISKSLLFEASVHCMRAGLKRKTRQTVGMTPAQIIRSQQELGRVPWGREFGSQH